MGICPKKGTVVSASERRGGARYKSHVKGGWNMQGMLVVEGKVVKPPFLVREEAEKIFVNDVQVYPPVEVEERPDLAKFGIEDVFSATEGTATLGKIGEVEQALEDFSTTKTKSKKAWGEFKTASFEQKSEEIKSFLENKGYKTELSANYQDVLVPINEDFGIVALFNEEARITVMREAEEKYKPETVLEYDVARDLSEYIESNLEEGNFLHFEKNVLEAIPEEQVDSIVEGQEETEEVAWGELEYEQKVARITEAVARVRVKKRPCSAAIFFPHRSWQKEVVGKASSYWSILANKLIAEGYWVRTYLDTAVTLNIWAGILAKGRDQNLRVIYNEGHGGGDRIYVGEPRLKGGWYYFTSGFVNKYAKLRNTIVFIHSCATMSNLKMAQAFRGKGACAYLGWKHNTSANPDYCDKVDALFWEPMIDLNSTAIYAKKNVETIDKDLKGHGNRFCRIPIKKWEC